MSAFAIVLASTACAGNSGENKKSNEPTKEENKMEVVSLNKAEFLKKVYDFEANPSGSLKEADLQSLIFTQPGAVRVKHFTPFSKNLARSTVVK